MEVKAYKLIITFLIHAISRYGDDLVMDRPCSLSHIFSQVYAYNMLITRWGNEKKLAERHVKTHFPIELELATFGPSPTFRRQCYTWKLLLPVLVSHLCY